MLDMPRVREVFEASTDFTVGIEDLELLLDADGEVLGLIEDLACTVHVKHVQVR